MATRGTDGRTIEITDQLFHRGNWYGRFIELFYHDYGVKRWTWKLHHVYKRTEMNNVLVGYVPLPADKHELTGLLADILVNENIELPQLAKEFHARRAERNW